MKCKICGNMAHVALKAHNAAFCAKCFLDFFRRQVKRGIEEKQLFSLENKILVAISGGKDSLSLLLELHEMGYHAHGLFVDLAIPESSVNARTYAQNFCDLHGLRLHVYELARDGLAIPEVKKHIRRPICSVCGKIKRYFFNRAALELGADVLATGHNLDDEVSRLFSNTLRWDEAYLADQGPALAASGGFVKKVKPLWRLGEFETANYAFLRGIAHHKSPCPYSHGASFTALKGIMQRLENLMPGKKLDFYQSFLKRGQPHFVARENTAKSTLQPCAQCGAPTSGDTLCGICRIRQQIGQARQQ